MQLGVIVGLLLGLALAFFAVLNTSAVTFNYYFGRVETSVAVLVLAAALLGALSVGLLSFLKQVRTGFTLWDYQNKVRRLSKEVEELKAQKAALSDDLSFLQSECEDKLRQQEARLEECHEQEKEQASMQKADEQENNIDRA